MTVNDEGTRTLSRTEVLLPRLSLWSYFWLMLSVAMETNAKPATRPLKSEHNRVKMLTVRRRAPGCHGDVELEPGGAGAQSG